MVGNTVPERRPIEPAATSVTALVGEASTGPLDEPTLVTRVAQFEAVFGSPSSPLGWAVADFFANDGAEALVVRTEKVRNALAALAASEQRFQLLVLDPAVVVPGDLAEADAVCEEVRAFLVGDAAPDGTVPGELTAVGARNAALYHPRLVDAAGVPRPAGPAVAGVFARNDRIRGVWRSCAGSSAQVLGAAGVERRLTDHELADLASRNVNALRVMPDGSTVVWGDRTVSAHPEWKYANARRTLLFVEHSVETGLAWVASERNAEPLWELVCVDVEEFLHELWRRGAFPGATAHEAYAVRCDRTTMTEDDVAAGRLVVHVGVATVRPAEFVVLRIGLHANPPA